jgi:RNA polymerase sigma-70 factor, ECF subfamily
MGYDSVTNGQLKPAACEPTSVSLLVRAKLREPEAWRQLVGLYGPLVYRWCRQSGLSPEDAGDVVQDVFQSAFGSLDDFRGDRPCGSFRGWLRGITRHRMIDHWRARRGEPQAAGGTGAQKAMLEVPDGAGSLAESDPPEVEDALWRRTLAGVQSEFEPRTWQAFWRVVVDAQRPARVAKELGMTLHAVYMAKSRVLRRVRRQFADLEGPA